MQGLLGAGAEDTPTGAEPAERSVAVGWAAPGGKSSDPQHHILWALSVLGAPASGKTHKEPAH